MLSFASRTAESVGQSTWLRAGDGRRSAAHPLEHPLAARELAAGAAHEPASHRADDGGEKVPADHIFGDVGQTRRVDGTLQSCLRVFPLDRTAVPLGIEGDGERGAGAPPVLLRQILSEARRAPLDAAGRHGLFRRGRWCALAPEHEQRLAAPAQGDADDEHRQGSRGPKPTSGVVTAAATHYT